MQRREAIRLFKEICKGMPEIVISSVSLTSIGRSQKEFEMRINTSLDPKNFKNVELLVQKHGLNLKQDKGSILVYGNAKQIEIIAQE